MAWDESGTKREVESLKKRYPKRGIDATIPEGIRATLREREQDKLTPESKYSKGGKTDMKKSKFSSGGTAKMATFTPTTAPSYQPEKGTAGMEKVELPPAPPMKVPTPMGPSSGAWSPSMGGRRPTAADALKYLRATGNKAGADEILKAAVGKPAKMPEDYGSVFKAGADSGSVGKAPLAEVAPPRAPTAAETAQLTRAGSSSAPQMDYVSGPGGTKVPISRGNRGVTPLPGSSLIGMPEATPEAIAAGKARDARRAAMNPPGSYTPPAGINMPGMRMPAPPRTPQQMMKKGGEAKAYASGGSIKGAGIAQRGVRKCKIV